MDVFSTHKEEQIVLTSPMRSIRTFLVWFFWIFIFFFVISSLVADANQLQNVLNSWDWLFVAFWVQQLLTLGVLFIALFSWWVTSRDAASTYLDERFKRKWFRLFWVWVVGGFVWYMILNATLFTVLSTLWWDIPWLYGEQWVMTMIWDLNMSSWFEWMLTALMVVFLWPIVEELVYRWLFTDVFMRRWWLRGVVLWAALFAWIHLEFAVIWNLFILAFILWVIYWKTESMRYSLLFHVIINWIWILALRADQMYDLSSYTWIQLF